MFDRIGNLFGLKPASKGGPMKLETQVQNSPLRDSNSERKQTFSKVFRWRLPAGYTQQPEKVEVVGSFNQWQRTPLAHDSVLDAWHATLHHIIGNRTHHYVILVDGKPTFDKNCDGMAVPHGPDEERFAIMTEKGPRVMMLFGQTK